MKICGLDPSLTRAGVAVLHNGQPTVLRSAGWGGKDSDSYAQRSERIVAQCRMVLSLIPTDCDLIVMEGPAYASKTGHAFDRAGLWWGLHAALHARHIPIAVCVPNTLKAWATGNGRAEKEDVHNAVKLRWPDIRVRNHDEADALALAELGAIKVNEPLPFPIPGRAQANIKAIAWPSNLCSKRDIAQVKA